MPMTPEAADLAVARGVDPALVAAHGARYLTPVRVRTADLVLAMARDHRREVVELDPRACDRPSRRASSPASPPI
jgi:protein-tyrosine phosphatase